MNPVFFLLLSSAVNNAQLHISHRLPLFIPHLQVVVYHSITSNCLCLQWKMSEMYVTLLSHSCLYIYLYIAVFQSCLSGNCLCDSSFTSLTLKSAEASKWLPCYCPFLCGTACPLSQGTKQVTFWWDACFLCSTERTIRLLLNLGFPCWLMKKHFHDFFISFTAIKGWSLELSPPLFFSFCSAKSNCTWE